MVSRLLLVGYLALIGQSLYAAAPVCNTGTCGVVQHHVPITHTVAQYKQVALAYLPVTYQIGAHLQQQAAAEYDFRRSPSQQRLDKLEGFYEGVMAVRDHALALQGQGPQQAAVNTFERRYPVLSQKCMACHNAEGSEGGLLFPPGTDVAQNGEAVERILTRAFNGEMPPNKPLTPAEYSQLEVELVGETEQQPAATPQPSAQPATPQPTTGQQTGPVLRPVLRVANVNPSLAQVPGIPGRQPIAAVNLKTMTAEDFVDP